MDVKDKDRIINLLNSMHEKAIRKHDYWIRKRYADEWAYDEFYRGYSAACFEMIANIEMIAREEAKP